MTKHKISRRDFLAALAAGTVAATACGLHRTFADASRTFEYWELNRELSFRRTREGIIYSCEGYPLTDGETSSPGYDNQTLDPAFDWFLGRNFGDPDNGFGLRHILYDTLYDPELGTNGYGQSVCLSLSQPLQDLVYHQLPPKNCSFGVGRCFTIVRQRGETKAWAENSLAQSVNDLLFYYCAALSYSSGANVLCNASGALEIVTTAALLEYDIPFALDASAEEKAALAAEALDSSYYCDVLQRYLAPEGLLCPLPTGALLQTDGGFLFNDEDLATQEAFRAAYSRIANGAVMCSLLLPLLWIESVADDCLCFQFECLAPNDFRRNHHDPSRVRLRTEHGTTSADSIRQVRLPEEKQAQLAEVFRRRAESLGLRAPEGAQLAAVDTGICRTEAGEEMHCLYLHCKLPSAEAGYSILLGRASNADQNLLRDAQQILDALAGQREM